MNESEERWARMERTMEFLLESDARISARLDVIGDRLDRMGDRLDSTGKHLDSMGTRIDALAATAERQQVEITPVRWK